VLFFGKNNISRIRPGYPLYMRMVAKSEIWASVFYRFFTYPIGHHYEPDVSKKKFLRTQFYCVYIEVGCNRQDLPHYSG